ncbi:hypothetical protein Bhyg_06154 [Pseudolycoriella hygida]|uniref:Uncharacterized protein n=1 Tax=Pseudolycoriella hygida TaxID=35572 RepID=A0A9Q0S1N6_9DIPT|nr:hypothetical protein Bhyg_06154 [Pseudolycoriella hygida]
MHYAKKPPSSRSTHSVYSHVSTRSSNIQTQRSRSTRSLKSLKPKWYQKPIIKNSDWINVQRGAMWTAIFSLFIAFFTIATAIFDIYCLAMAAPGTTHYGYYFISYQFVYVGNVHVRNALIVFAMFSLLGGFVIVVTSTMLILALRKEHEHKFVPWLWTYAIFIGFRLLASLFFAIVNDLIFAYNVLIVLFWSAFCIGSIYGWLLVYSLYLELANLTKLEDLAYLRMGTMQSLHASTTHSLMGSRPITPHTTTASTLQMHSIIN